MDRRTFMQSALGTSALVALPALIAPAAKADTVTNPPPVLGQLLWSDEFDGPAGSAPNPANWGYQVNRYGKGAGERQYYTNSRANSYLDGASGLVIQPLEQTPPDGAAAPYDYTSARLVTRGLHQFSPPVRIQASIRVPAGFGIMPAFWALGADPARPESWPHEGEIDMMEAIRVGYPTSWLPQTLHGPSLANGSAFAMGNTYRGTIPLDGGLHAYGVDWYVDRMDFHLDGAVIFTISKAAYIAAGGDWTPFSGAWPMYLLLNIAVLSTDPSQIVLQPMTVDWVRVWSLQTTP